MTDPDMQKMIYNAGHGRGLWIGLHVEPSTEHEAVKRQLDAVNDSTLVMKSMNDVHLTVAHLGRDNTAKTVESALASCEAVASFTSEEILLVEAVARMQRHVVAIVAPRWIDRVCDDVKSALRDRGVSPDESFAGIRHVTMAEIKRGVELVVLPATARHKMTTKKLIVVCGDARAEFPLQQSPIPF